jgi:hypothetical protein
MKSPRQLLSSLLIAATAAVAIPAMSGCLAAEGSYVVEDSPPAPREEVVVSRPGYVWVHGRWTHPGRHWLWQSGRYERERNNQVYVEGRWERRGTGHVWVDGGWRARGGVVLR